MSGHFSMLARLLLACERLPAHPALQAVHRGGEGLQSLATSSLAQGSRGSARKSRRISVSVLFAQVADELLSSREEVFVPFRKDSRVEL